MKKKIIIIKYDNSGNIGSLMNILDDINKKNNFKFKIQLSKKVEDVHKADIVILPGVGQFDEVMSFLNKNKLNNTLKRHAKNKPIIGICIGMQILFNNSEEGNLKGLGFIKGVVKKIKEKRTPIIGWKKTLKCKDNKFIESEFNQTYLYYLHSYEVFPENKKNILMNSVVNNNTIAAFVMKKNLIGLQFHPELSSISGFRILENILLKYS
tara:strand:- start:1410 stop:2039 length:630 start_codon:yes stop_codon:yes gene_type:complete